MLINQQYHLTYCTNIHSEKSWAELFASLQETLPKIKREVSPDNPFGVGLRLSDYTGKELLEEKNLMRFKDWLEENGLYVFTMNGFPYGMFHNRVVKEDVHKPDWTTIERVEYTKRLCRILAVLLPNGMEGGISTSPLSYKPWHIEEKKMQHVYKNSALHLAMVVGEMLRIRKDTGKVIHLDIEPEPDGLLENSEEVVAFFEKYVFVAGVDYLVENFSISPSVAEEALMTHLRVCYDVCHFAVAYEDQREAISKLEKAGIRIGKVQLSSALKADFSNATEARSIMKEVGKLDDPVYLHQVIEKDANGKITQYRDLSEAMSGKNPTAKQWRIHFHVPLFTEMYGKLCSTQEDVTAVLELLKEKKFTNHLEVETYTWEVLPREMKIDLKTSITRELKWVLKKLEVSLAVHE